jgi:lipoprotein-anchoring transpeptidase ErfK/SrfK
MRAKGALLGLGCFAALASAAPVGAAKLAGEVTISDERSSSRWAYPIDTVPIRAQPSRSARRVGKLRLNTEDGFPEVYLVLTRWQAPNGSVWLKIRVPKRPNGSTGWVPSEALGELRTNRYSVVIDRRKLRLSVLRKGKKIFSAPVGIGKPGTITPAGRFYIREKFRVRGDAAYGPAAFGTSAYAPTLSEWPNGGVVGIHGTNQPGLVPGRPSHGCIRMHNSDVLRLYRLVGPGTPLRIV